MVAALGGDLHDFFSLASHFLLHLVFLAFGLVVRLVIASCLGYLVFGAFLLLMLLLGTFAFGEVFLHLLP